MSAISNLFEKPAGNRRSLILFAYLSLTIASLVAISYNPIAAVFIVALAFFWLDVRQLYFSFYKGFLTGKEYKYKISFVVGLATLALMPIVIIAGLSPVYGIVLFLALSLILQKVSSAIYEVKNNEFKPENYKPSIDDVLALIPGTDQCSKAFQEVVKPEL